MRNFLLTGIFAFWASMFLVNDPRRRQMFDWFCAGALGVIMPGGNDRLMLVRGNHGPGVFEVFALHPIPLGTLIILLSPGPVRLIVSKNSTAKLLGWLLVLLGGMPDFSHPQAGDLAGAGRHAGNRDDLPGRRRKYLVNINIIGYRLDPASASSTPVCPSRPEHWSLPDYIASPGIISLCPARLENPSVHGHRLASIHS